MFEVQMRRQRAEDIDEIRDIAYSEPFGGRLFNTHVGILLIGSGVGYVVLGLWWLPVWLVAYVALFAFEKRYARRAADRHLNDALPWLRGTLLARVVVYDLLVIYLWSLEGDVYKLGSLALLVGATVNSFVSQGRFATTISCVAIPNALVFFALAGLEYHNSGLSPEFAGSLVAACCVVPFLLLSIRHTAFQQAEVHRAIEELTRIRTAENMGQVAAGVAHDFNNLVSVISGSLELAKDTKDHEARYVLLTTAQEAAGQASNLTRQMLALGRSSPLLPTAIRLSDFVDEFAAFASRTLPPNISLTVGNQSRDAVVFVDTQMLRSALLNLMRNAKDAMTSGGEIRITSGLVHAPSSFPAQYAFAGKCAFLTISDTGGGIPQRLMTRVFEPFFSTKPLHDGTGLGLAMVKGFAEQSNGSVCLSSSPETGTDITMFLPLADTLEMPASPEVKLAVETQKMMGSRRVLLVEDNNQLRELIALKLKSEGHQVEEYPSAEDALPALDSGSDFEVLITDQVMPGHLSGTDLVELVRQRRPGIKTILMSGYADQSRIEGVDLRVADRFLEKPISLNDLPAAIQGLFEQPPS